MGKTQEEDLIMAGNTGMHHGQSLTRTLLMERESWDTRRRRLASSK